MRGHLLDRGRVCGSWSVASAIALTLALLPSAAASNVVNSKEASVCGKVSAAAVSAIVGYTLPTATSFSRHIAASALNHEVSADQTICTFGLENSIPELKKDVSLSVETISKPLTAAEVVADLKKTSSTQLKVSASIDLALGGQVVGFTESGSGLVGTGLALINGTTEYGASVEQPITNAKLAALLKLAQKL